MIEVRRMPRNTTAGFERIPNQAVRNVELSLAAVGLLVRLLADGEQYDSIDEIAAAFNPASPGQKTPYGFGRDVYRKAALELEAAGHLVRTEQKGAGSRTQSLVRALPEKAQVDPTTDSPSRGRRARTGITAAQSRDGLSVVGSTWENDAYGHVESATDCPSRDSPARTPLSARQPRDGQSVADYMQTSFQTSDLPSPTLTTLGEEDGDNFAAEARSILDGLPAERSPGRGDRKVLTPALIELLRLGHPAVEMSAILTNHAMPDAVRSLGALMCSWLPEAEPYMPTPGHASARASPDCDSENCHAGKIEDSETGRPAWCPTCHPERNRSST